eukprot:COSAG05_NODE_1293_length_5260_cov_2.373571_1_plen_40_part_00
MATGRFMQSGSVTHASRAIETDQARAYAMGTAPIAFARA